MPPKTEKKQQNNIGNYAALDEDEQAGCIPYIHCEASVPHFKNVNMTSPQRSQ